MEIEAYLDRIGYQGPREPTADALRQLHRAHLLTVAFEILISSWAARLFCPCRRFTTRSFSTGAADSVMSSMVYSDGCSNSLGSRSKNYQHAF
jgi:hypothetical protein